jgi:hypothetical protein
VPLLDVLNSTPAGGDFLVALASIETWLDIKPAFSRLTFYSVFFSQNPGFDLRDDIHKILNFFLKDAIRVIPIKLKITDGIGVVHRRSHTRGRGEPEALQPFSLYSQESLTCDISPIVTIPTIVAH